MAARSHYPVTHLWVKSEPFCFGILPISQHPKYTERSLKRIVPYARGKKELGFPKLRYSLWRHIACTKLELAEELAWMFYCIYHSLTKMRPEDRIQWDKEFAKHNWGFRDQLKNLAVVDTMKFVLLLYIQLINKTKMRSSSVSSLSTEERWPTQSRSSEYAEGKSLQRDRKFADEQRFLQFIVNNLEEILELLSGGTELNVGGNITFVPSEAVSALGFLLEGCVDERNRSVKALSELVNLHNNQCGYSTTHQAFKLKPLAKWLKTKLGTNPFGISSCLVSGRRLSWPAVVKEKQEKQNLQLGRIATNDHYAPKGKKVIILSYLMSQLICRTHRSLRGFQVQLYRCQDSFIYLLAPLKFVTIYKCYNCTFVLGAVGSCIYVTDCHNVKVVSATRRIWINNTIGSSFYVLTPTQPLLTGNKNDSIVMAPYCTHYPLLEPHMTEVGLCAVPNFWNYPICVSSVGTVEDLRCWQSMSPREFYTITVPFKMEGPTTSIPGGLPAEYEEVDKQREHVFENWKRTVDEANLNDVQKQQLQQIVQARFQAWLVKTGIQHELDLLANAQNVKDPRPHHREAPKAEGGGL